MTRATMNPMSATSQIPFSDSCDMKLIVIIIVILNRALPLYAGEVALTSGAAE